LEADLRTGAEPLDIRTGVTSLPARARAPTRAKAFEAARDLAIECLARDEEFREGCVFFA